MREFLFSSPAFGWQSEFEAELTDDERNAIDHGNAEKVLRI